MIHTYDLYVHDANVLLCWNNFGIENIALCCLIAKYTVWLYNQMSNRVTGLSPIELLARRKIDHHDILQTHIWGCPVYVWIPLYKLGRKLHLQDSIPY